MCASRVKETAYSLVRRQALVALVGAIDAESNRCETCGGGPQGPVFAWRQSSWCIDKLLTMKSTQGSAQTRKVLP